MKTFDKIVVEVTQACQHSCRHCYNYWRTERAPVNDQDTLSRAEIRYLVRKIRQEFPIRQLALSGGEPLMREDLPEIVCDLVEDELGVVVITNGGFLDAERAARFPEGTIFEITLFSTEAQVHDQIAGKKGAFENVIRAAVNAKKNKCRLAVAIVVSQFNSENIRPTMELGIALGADAFLINRVNLTSLTLPMAKHLVPGERQLRHALEAADSVAADYGASVSVSVPIPPCVLDPGPFKNLHFGWCPRGGNEAYYTIGYNGMVRPCNHSSVLLGDLRTRKFSEIVNSDASREFWEPTPDACRTCQHELANLCRGGCPAASHECYGSSNRWDPYIDVLQAEKENIME